MMPTLTLYVLGFVCSILITIVILVLKSKGDPLSDFTPEQRKALHFQNNVLTFLMFVTLVLPLLCAIISYLTKIDIYSEGVKNFLKTYGFFLFIGAATVIALSSIISKASFLPPRRYSREFSKGTAAVNEGLMILLIVVVALLAWFGSK